ncbi:MAG: EAL domain-containing protein [Chromatiales bacterium]|nr:EAL domain-containing protein [Chromatiales bacterium]
MNLKLKQTQYNLVCQPAGPVSGTGTASTHPSTCSQYDPDNPNLQEEKYWQLLIVDDEPSWHSTIRLALGDAVIEERPLKLIFASSGAEAESLLAETPDIALVLLDVVMESEQAGLNLVRKIREQLNNQKTQIAIVTGQPAYAPEHIVVEQYQINDYRLKTDLSVEKLLALTCTAIRAYHSLCKLIESQENLSKTARARREAETRYQDLYDNAPDMYASVDVVSTKILRCNMTLVKNLGYADKQEVIDRPVFDMVLPEDEERTKEAFRRFIKSGEINDMELRLRRKDRTGMDVSLNISAWHDMHGNITEARCSWRDITERKASEAAARESQERYRAIFGQAAVGLARLAIGGTWLEVNDKLCEILGYSKSELLEQSIQAITFPDDLNTSLEYMQQLLDGEKEVGSIEQRVLHKSGQSLWINLTLSLVYDKEGEPKYFVSVIEDIVQRKLSEDRLRQAAAVFMNTAEGVIITDLDGSILDVNRAFCEITGYSKDEVIGQNPRILKSGRHDKEFYKTLWFSLITRGEWRGEIWNRRKDGNIYPELLTISAIRNPNGNPAGYVGVSTDVTSDKEAQYQLQHMAYHDPLTDLPNRRFFNAKLNQSIRLAARRGSTLAVVFIDLDHFKRINDSMGHDVGDELLKQFAQRLQNTIRVSDSVARISGDEFILLLEEIKGQADASIAVTSIMNDLKAPFDLDGRRIRITFSVGISLYPDDGKDSMHLLRNADTAMYSAKENGRNGYQFYKREMTSAAFEYVILENELRVALERAEFELLYQPQINIESEQLIGLEALIRWQHPQQGTILPSRFISIAEQNGLIHEIGAWVLMTACTQGKAWLDKGIEIARIAVNVAGPQILHGDFLTIVHKALSATGMPKHHLTLEVTESFIMSRTEDGIGQLKALQELGIEIAIDDFGTGYSSLNHLKQLPIDKLKIDQSFVRDIPDDSNDMAISEAVIALGNALNMRVIAEGVETSEQAMFLKEKGCQEAQGYFYGKPMTPAQIEDWLSSRKASDRGEEEADSD